MTGGGVAVVVVDGMKPATSLPPVIAVVVAVVDGMKPATSLPPVIAVVVVGK